MSSPFRNPGRIIAIAALATTALLASCDDSQESASEAQNSAAQSAAAQGSDSMESDQKSTVVVTKTQSEEEASSAKSSKKQDGDAKEGESESGENCSVDTEADVISEAVDEVNDRYPNKFGGWTYDGESNYDTCSDLTYAMVEQAEQGNSQFGTLILMFHRGEYIGIDSTHPQQATNIVPNDDGFSVTYKDWEALEESGAANAAAPEFTSDVTYYWDGDKVAHEGRIPNTGLNH